MRRLYHTNVQKSSGFGAFRWMKQSVEPKKSKSRSENQGRIGPGENLYDCDRDSSETVGPVEPSDWLAVMEEKIRTQNPDRRRICQDVKEEDHEVP